jgi:non-canonical (house-cleaning) NTP pyrophosphatase
MKVIVGTQKKRKLSAVESVTNSLIEAEGVSVSGCLAASGVRNTPLAEETKQGAINRANNSMSCEPEADMYIGIESGLVQRYGEWFEEVWVAARYDGEIFTAYSSGLALPPIVRDQLNADVQNHQDIMNALRAEYELDIHSELGADTWGNYTGGVLVRDVGLAEAVRNTLVPIFPQANSFYQRQIKL